MTKILSKHEYLHGPCERGDLIRTVQALAEALREVLDRHGAGDTISGVLEGVADGDEVFVRHLASCVGCQAVARLREKGWLTPLEADDE